MGVRYWRGGELAWGGGGRVAGGAREFWKRTGRAEGEAVRRELVWGVWEGVGRVLLRVFWRRNLAVLRGREL